MIRVEQFYNELAPMTICEKKPRPASKAWMTSERRRKHADIAFEPEQPPITSDNCINTWTGWGRKPERGDIGPFLELLNHLVVSMAIRSKPTTSSTGVLTRFSIPVRKSTTPFCCTQALRG
jgi:hypothetical protein